jgi:tRNA threonylcarbamoyladenosine biosynthesis protein TsaE
MGPLGAGKTCLVQGIVKGLHPGAPYPVRSPSFTIISEYPGPVPIYHIDLFRLEGQPENTEIGVEDLLGSDAYCLIEWADRCPQWLPAERLDIYLSIEGHSERRLSVIPRGERWVLVEEQIRRALQEAI